MNKFTETAKILIGSMITYLSGFFGGMDGVMLALAVFITLDYISCAAAAAKKHRLSS